MRRGTTPAITLTVDADLTGVTLSKNQTVAVYARSRGSNYYAYVGTLIIKQTA